MRRVQISCTNIVWYLYSFRPLFLLYEAELDNNISCYMTSSVNGQDEPNLALWLAVIELSCPLRIWALSRKENLHVSCFGVLYHLINPLLTKLVQSRWLDIGFVLWTSNLSQSINTQKKNLANIQQSWPRAWSITIYFQDVVKVEQRTNNERHTTLCENIETLLCSLVVTKMYEK